jgi:hypothetical protein
MLFLQHHAKTHPRRAGPNKFTWKLALQRPGWIDPLIAPVVKTVKLAIYLFLEIWLQICFQKYHISPNDIQFLINKDKNRGKF